MGAALRRNICKYLYWNLRKKWWDDERERHSKLLKLESTTGIFIDQVHKFQNSDFKEYPWKAAAVLQKSMYFRNMLWNNECIDLCFQFPKYRTVRCIKLSFYHIRPLCRAVNERKYWFVKMNIKKTLLPSALSFLILNLVEKAVLHYAGLCKSALRNNQLITSNAENLEGKSWKR